MGAHVKSEFEAIYGINSFHRVDATHPLDLYIGKDHMARYSLLLISENEPQRIFSSRIIAVDIGHRDDGRWALSLSLSDERFMDIFCHFCDDIINSSRSIPDTKQDMIFVCGRYDKWQEMLRKNRSGVLSEAAIKGLIGELLFLKYYLFPTYGIDSSLNSWIGPERADQDFVCIDKWYEVKTTTSGNESVRISSIEQLDSSVPGEIVIVYLDKTSHTNSDGITLNWLVTNIDNELMTFEQHKHFRDILLEQEYVSRDEYDQYVYSMNTYKRYNVGPDFPSLRRKDMPDAVINANYNLSISAIAAFLREEKEERE